MGFRVKKKCKLGHVTFKGHFPREKLKLEMAPFYNGSQFNQRNCNQKCPWMNE